MVREIKLFATRKGITLKAVEEQANIPKGTMGRWDSHRPSIDKVKRVADALGITVDDLLREEANGNDDGNARLEEVRRNVGGTN